MRYVDREGWVEHYPESDADMKFLSSQYGATGSFQCWCVAKKPKAPLAAL